MINVASALISGVAPSFIFEKISIGRVLPPGPDTNVAITRSSRLYFSKLRDDQALSLACICQCSAISFSSGFIPALLEFCSDREKQHANNWIPSVAPQFGQMTSD